MLKCRTDKEPEQASSQASIKYIVELLFMQFTCKQRIFRAANIGLGAYKINL